MNEITTIPNMDSDQVAALMAELHAAGTPNNGSNGEATPEEGTFVSEADDSVAVTIN